MHGTWITDCTETLELEASLHDDDNVYHYRAVQPQYSDDRDAAAVPKINHASAGGHHLDVDYSSGPGYSEDGGGAFVTRASLMLSLGVGAGVVLVVLILGGMCAVVWRSRRGRQKAVQRRDRPPVVDSYALVPLTSRRPELDPLPAVVDTTSPPLGPRRTPPSTATTPRSGRSAVGRATAAGVPPASTTPRCTSRAAAGRTPVTSPSVQQLEWQRMLRTAECDDVVNFADEDDVIDGGDVPPPLPAPPAFLLRAGGGGGGGEGRGRAPLVTDEILDGYHSGDNVDDDIERIGYVGGIGAGPVRPQHANRH